MRAPKVGVGQFRAGGERLEEITSRQVRPFQVGAGQVGLAQG